MQQSEYFIMKSLHNRAKHNFSFIKPFIEGESVLDIGAAEGWIAKGFHKHILYVLDMDKEAFRS